MKKILLTTLVLPLMFFLGCSKYEVQYEGAYDDNVGIALKSKSKDHQIIYVESGKLYAIDPTLSDIRAYTTLPAGIVYASINYAHDKIAYKTATGNITIIDTAGTQLSTVTATNTVTLFDWHPNNQTLYYMSGFTLKFHGPTVKTPQVNFGGLFPTPTDNKFLGITIREDGTYVCMIQYLAGTYQRNIYVSSLSGNMTEYRLGRISNNVLWFRSTIKGNYVYFGGTESNKLVSFQSPVDINYRDEPLNYIYFIAPSPDGLYEIKATDTELFVNIKNTTYRKPVVGTKITALDW
jgi:hypothetical protein